MELPDTYRHTTPAQKPAGPQAPAHALPRGLSKADIELYAPRLSLRRHTGLLLAWQQQEYIFRGRPEAVKPELVSITIKNLLFGWWSVMSLFINPVITLANWISYALYKRQFEKFLADPEQYLLDAKMSAQK